MTTAIETDPADPVAGDAAARPGLADKLFGESSLYFVANIAGRAIGFVMIPFYARCLSAEQYGVVNLVELATLVVAIAFGLQSIGAALTRIWHEQTDEAGRHAVVATALGLAAVLGGTIGIAAAAAAEPVSRALALGGYANLLRFAFLALFLSSIVELATSVERMEGRARFVVGLTLAQTLATVALNIVFLGFAHFGVWGFVSAKVVVLVVSAALLLRRIAARSGFALRLSLVRPLLRFGAPLVLSSTAYFAIHFADRIFLAHVSRAETGIYALAYNFAFLLSILIGDSFQKSWGVSFYAYAADPGWQRRFARVALWLVFILGTGAAGITLFGRDVLRLMVPPSYWPPFLLLPLLVVGYFLREVGDFFANLLLIEKRSGEVGRIAGASAALNIVCNIVLIGRYGILGAAWATFLTWAAYCMVAWAAAWRRFRVPFGAGNLLRLFVIGAAVGLPWARLSPHGAAAALLLDTLWFALFVTLAWLLYLGREDRRDAAVWLGTTLKALRG